MVLKNKDKEHRQIVRIMDTIVFNKNPYHDYSKPFKWIYTDLLGRIQNKDVQKLELQNLKQFLMKFLTQQ